MFTVFIENLDHCASICLDSGTQCFSVGYRNIVIENFRLCSYVVTQTGIKGFGFELNSFSIFLEADVLNCIRSRICRIPENNFLFAV